MPRTAIFYYKIFYVINITIRVRKHCQVYNHDTREGCFYFNLKNLVLWTWTEIIGFAWVNKSY